MSPLLVIIIIIIIIIMKNAKHGPSGRVWGHVP